MRYAAKHFRIDVSQILMPVVFVALLHSCALDRASVPARDKYVGLTRQQIIAQLGTPTGQFAGHYGAPPAEWARQHRHVVTYTYVRPTGTLYLSVEPFGDQSVCICSD